MILPIVASIAFFFVIFEFSGVSRNGFLDGQLRS